MEKITARGLAALIAWGVLTIWVRERWATSVLECGLFALAAPWAVQAIRPQPAPRGSWLLVPLGGTVAWGLLQLAIGSSGYRFATWNAALGWAAALTAFWLALQALRPARLRRLFLRALAGFGFLLSVVAVLAYFTARGRIFWIFPSGYTEVLGPFVSRNTHAAFIELLLPLALVECLRRRGPRLLWTLAAGVMFASVVAGASRAGTLLVALEVTVVMWLATRRRHAGARELLAGLSRIAGVAALFTLVVGWQPVWNRFREPDPFLHRQDLLSSTLGMIADRPWLGWGLGTWPVVYPAYARFDIGMFANHAHNNWAEWTAEGGLPFVLLLLAVAVWSARLALRRPWGLGVPAVFLHSLVDFPLQHPALNMPLFTLLGAMAAAEPDDSRPARPGAPASAGQSDD